MPHISKKIIDKKVFNEIKDELPNVLIHLLEYNRSDIFVSELLTDTERLMLSKRLAIVVMLARGDSFGDIGTKLGVTPQTISRVYDNMRSGEYKDLILALDPKKSKKGSKNLLNLFGILPPITGSGRWDELQSSLGSKQHYRNI